MPAPPAPLKEAPSVKGSAKGSSKGVVDKDIGSAITSTDEGNAQVPDTSPENKSGIKKCLWVLGVGVAVTALILQGTSSCDTEKEQVDIEEKEPEEENVEWWQKVKAWIMRVVGKKDDEDVKVASVYQFEQGHGL